MATKYRHLQLPMTLAYAKGAYTAEVSFGSRDCVAQLLLDTGSSTLAVSPKVYRSDTDEHRQATPLAQEVAYGQGAWAGPVLRSRVAFGEGIHARVLSDSPFALMENEVAAFRDADGILGLAFQGLNHAHDVAELLRERGHEPAVTWPWPFSEDVRADYAAFKSQLNAQPRVNVAPFFSALESEGVVADKFAMQIGRSIVHVLDDAHGPSQLARDPLNRGVLVVGGGEECQDLYDGAFQTIRIVHELYYNANLLSVQVGACEPIPAPALDPAYARRAASNAIIDTGASFLVLENTIYDRVLADLATYNESFPKLIEASQTALRDERGIANARIRGQDWPDLHFVFEGLDGATARVSCEPGEYWQKNALRAGESICLLMRQMPRWPNQTIIGLPLLAGRYCVFDRRDDALGVVRLARAQTQRK